MSAETTAQLAGLACPRAAHLVDSAVDVNEVPDGLVIYHSATNQVHYLNATAAAVYLLCDGAADLAAIAEDIRQLWELPDAPMQIVRECIADLADRRLVLR